jgi:hypothetical protein
LDLEERKALKSFTCLNFLGGVLTELDFFFFEDIPTALKVSPEPFQVEL